MKRPSYPAATPVTPVDTADADTPHGPNSVSVDSVSGGDPTFGEPIHVYTRADALADGVLVDVTEPATAGMLGGFAVPVAVTAAVWAAIEAIPASLRGLASSRGRLHDVLWMANLAVRRHTASSGLLRFQVILPQRGTRKRVRTFCAHVGPDDQGRPCVTIGYPEDF